MLDEATIARIAAMDDVVLRNLWITQTYAELGSRITSVVSRPDANWCTFAVWASRSVGSAIRGEAVPRWLVALSEASGGWTIPDAAPPPLPHWLARWHRSVGAIERSLLMNDFDVLCSQVSGHLAAGNVLVFAELAPLFLRFCEEPDGELPIEPQPHEQGEDVSRLVDAFALYRAARGAAAVGDDRSAAQHVLCANVLIGLHEQVRLQPAIEAGIDAAADDVSCWVRELDRHAHHAGVVGRTFRRLWEHVATSAGVLLGTPEGPLHAGHDVPPPPQAPLFVPPLDNLRLAEAAALFERYARGVDAEGRGSRAEDWVVLKDRMRFIATLFRSRQRSPLWQEAPFTHSQLEELRKGKRPGGVL